jgi:SAM-dependent methyltransferase
MSKSTSRGAHEPHVRLGSSVHRVPKARLVDRTTFVTNFVAGKSVVDLGFVDESRMVSKQSLGTWLHAGVARAARTAVGIDSDPEGVELARQFGYEAYAADCEDRRELAELGLEPADVVVAGEIIEHLDQPGRFLEAVKVLLHDQGTLLITTPNACSMTNFVSGLMRRELVNPDHVGWYSWHTLRTLLGRHGWELRDVSYYGFPRVSASLAASFLERAQARVFNTYQFLSRPLFRLRPPLADGIIVVATPNGRLDGA